MSEVEYTVFITPLWTWDGVMLMVWTIEEDGIHIIAFQPLPEDAEV